MTIYVRKRTAIFAAVLLFEVGCFLGIEATNWGVEYEREVARIAEPVACIAPPPYPVAERESCTEVTRACYARKRQERVKAKQSL